MDTLLLDTATWDLTLDVNGSIAIASAPYALAQDAASCVRTFVGECYYDTSRGLPYFGQILGRSQSSSAFKAAAEKAALTVPEVATATCILTGIDATRRLSGQIQVTQSNGTSAVVGF